MCVKSSTYGAQTIALILVIGYRIVILLVAIGNLAQRCTIAFQFTYSIYLLVGGKGHGVGVGVYGLSPGDVRLVTIEQEAESSVAYHIGSHLSAHSLS